MWGLLCYHLCEVHDCQIQCELLKKSTGDGSTWNEMVPHMLHSMVFLVESTEVLVPFGTLLACGKKGLPDRFFVTLAPLLSPVTTGLLVPLMAVLGAIDGSAGCH